MSDLLNTPDPSNFILCLQITVIEFVNIGRNLKDREVIHIFGIHFSNATPVSLLREYARLTISEIFSSLLVNFHVVNGKFFRPARNFLCNK